MALDLPVFMTSGNTVILIHLVILFSVLSVTVMIVRHAISAHTTSSRSKIGLLVPVLAAIFLGVNMLPINFSGSAVATAGSTRAEQKNVILIGIDSVSWHHLESNLGALPNISRILKDGYMWTDVVTPLARTFPAWNSVLTGTYPSTHGALYNLMPGDRVLKDNLANHFKSKGYTTIYAQDERRFNNIDESYGFDYVVGPKVGAADFILPMFSDHPISNVLYRFSLGQRLFPYLALNRVAEYTYHPSLFVDSISEQLTEASSPLFLATHLCMTHFPYAWATSKEMPGGLAAEHEAALRAVDNQVGGLVGMLKKSHVLDNALLVLFSDHGESIVGGNNEFYSDIEKFVGKKQEFHSFVEYKLFSTTTGHGYMLNSKSQYGSFVVFKEFPVSGDLVGRSASRISLVSIAPTILDLLSNEAIGEGVSLLNHMKNGAALSAGPVYSETGLFLSAIMDPENVDVGEVLNMANRSYEVLENGKVQLTDSAVRTLLNVKEYAVFYQEWLLMNVQVDHQNSYVLANMNTGEWTYDWESALAKSAPVDKLMSLIAQKRNLTMASVGAESMEKVTN